MWRKIQAIVGALCIVLYAGVAFWAGFSVYRSLNRHKTLAEKEFKDLADFAASAGVLGFTGQNFRDDIESALVQAQTLQAAIFTGPDGQLVALEKTRGALVWDGDIPRFSGNFVLFRKPFGTTLRVEGLPSARIGAVASSVDYDALVRVLRTGLFAVMLASAAAFGTLMLGFVPALNRDASPDSAPDDEADDEADGSIYDDTVAWPEEGGGDAAETAAGTAATSGADEPEDAAGEAAEAALFAESPAVLDSEAALFSEPAPDEKPDILADDALFDGVDGPDSVEEALPSSLPDLDDLLEPFGEIPADAEDEPAPEDDAFAMPELDALRDGEDAATLLSGDAPAEADVPEPPVEADGGDLPVYDGFGDELNEQTPSTQRGLLAAASRVYQQDGFLGEGESEACTQALEAGLENAAENDEDLCLIAARWTEGENTTEALLAAARDFFSQSAEVFERRGGGVIVIVPDTALDEAFSLAKTFHAKASGATAEDDLLTIGMSAAGGRRVTAARLLKEADKALEKGAEDDALPIVAFKVDVEKYNRMYSSESD